MSFQTVWLPRCKALGGGGLCILPGLGSRRNLGLPVWLGNVCEVSWIWTLLFYSDCGVRNRFLAPSSQRRQAARLEALADSYERGATVGRLVDCSVGAVLAR